MRLVLASGSPRRRELLATIVREFEVVPSEIDETLEAGPTSEAVARLAARKAQAVAGRMGEGVVLGADTVVVLDGQVLGKPGGAGEAGAMLRRLRGREHEVITGIAAVDAGRGREASRAVVSRVLMADYSDATLGGALVARLVGSYTNVVGLPVEETRELLAGFGVLFSAPQSP